jgi:Ca2+-binding RTX toxin-like protein
MAATRNPTDIPFASTSVWNIGIGSNAQWSQSTDVDARQLHSLYGTVNAAAYGQPIYFGTASDPLVTVTNSDTLYPVPPQRIHIPANALAANGTDAHMAFYDATQPGKLWSYFGCSFVNGRDVTGGITTGLGGVWDTTGDGVTNTVAPGSDYNFAVGVITDYDVSQGAINHMVRLAISTNALKSPGANWMENIPWPNIHEDYWGAQVYTGNIVAGSTFGIPMSVNLNSLGLSQGGMMLAKALQNYGGLWRDAGGTDQIIFYSTPENQNNPLIQQMQADMAKIVSQIEVMRNQGPNSVNGGGTPVVPPLPPVLGGVIVEPPQPVTPITFGTGPDSLVLEVCDDAYANGDGTSNANGDATFTISIDGKQIGGTFTTIASHAAGQDQDLTLNGYFGPGTHSVSVNFLNDAYNNPPSTDRNLYVDSVTYKGVNTNQAGQLLSAGAKGFTVSGGTSEPPPIQPITFGTGPDSLVIEVCDDAYANGDGTSNANGDATFTVSIDGKQIGGTFTTTASHAAGQDQDLTLNGYFGPGTHSVSVNFLNDAYNNTPSTDRNLYVDSVTYKGVNTNQAGQFLSAGAQAFTVSGGTSVNTVTGGPGNDTLNGGVGNDTLTGLGGNDILNGGAGADTMVGGAGNDIYFVDNAADVVNEAAGGGNDDILTKINYVLAAGTEVEGLQANAGATGLTLTGNEFNNILVGNVGNDTLLGGAGNDAINGGVGADTMAGGIGNDTYFVDNAADVVNETAGQGTDTVMASVNYALTAGSEIEFLRANAGASGLSLTGNALVNRLVGGAGNDSLGGGAGNDVFKFLAGFGQDTITDFAAGPAGSQDLIDISGLGITPATFAANVHTANGGGGSTMVSFGGSANSIRLLNVAPANFDVTDCKLA